MAVELAQGIVNITPSAEGIGAEIFKAMVGPVGDAAQKAGEEAGKKMSGGLLSNVSDTGKKLIAALGLAAVGAFAIKSALDVEDAQNIIARSTGATGKALDGLQESFKNIASSSGASFETIATTLSELSQNTGLTGKALESLTLQVVTFNRITKDSPITVDLLTHALAGFNVPGKEMGKVLDELFKISQKTGIPLADLLGTLQTAGPIARQFGFSVEFTATLLAQLAKSGVDANQVMPGLKKAFVEFAKEGREPGKALQETLDALDKLVKAGDLIGARQLAVQIFGPKGAGLVDAALAGKLSLQDLGTSIALTGDGILDTAGKTGTLSGAMGVLKNNLKLALAEFATPALEAANTALRAVLPTIKDIGKEFATLPDGAKLAAVALVGLVSLAGPIGQFGQGIQGISTVVHGIGDAFTFAGVLGLEFIETLKAITLAGALTAGGITLGLAAIAAGFVIILTSSEPLARSLQEAESAGKQFGNSFVKSAKSSADELKTVQTELNRVDASMKRIRNDPAVKDILDSGSQQLIIESEAASTAQLVLHGLGEEHNVLKGRVKELRTELAEAKAQEDITAASTKKYNDEVAAGGSATGAFARLTDDARKALVEFQDAILAAAGGDIGRQQALINLAKAQQDQVDKTEVRIAAEAAYEKAVRESGEGSVVAFLASVDLDKARQDETQSTLDLRSAELQGASATETLDAAKLSLLQKLQDTPGFYDSEIARLKQLQIENPLVAAGYQLEIDKLNDTKAMLDRIHGFVAQAKVNADTAEAEAAFGRILTLMSNINAAFEGSPANFGAFGHGPKLPANFQEWLDSLNGGGPGIHALLGHASGGIFTKATVGVFGEAGPEAILPLNDPARSFQILGATGLLGDRASVQQSPSGPLVNIEHWHGGNPNEDGFTIAKKLRTFASAAGRS